MTHRSKENREAKISTDLAREFFDSISSKLKSLLPSDSSRLEDSEVCLITFLLEEFEKIPPENLSADKFVKAEQLAIIRSSQHIEELKQESTVQGVRDGSIPEKLAAIQNHVRLISALAGALTGAEKPADTAQQAEALRRVILPDSFALEVQRAAEFLKPVALTTQTELTAQKTMEIATEFANWFRKELAMELIGCGKMPSQLHIAVEGVDFSISRSLNPILAAANGGVGIYWWDGLTVQSVSVCTPIGQINIYTKPRNYSEYYDKNAIRKVMEKAKKHFSLSETNLTFAKLFADSDDKYFQIGGTPTHEDLPVFFPVKEGISNLSFEERSRIFLSSTKGDFMPTRFVSLTEDEIASAIESGDKEKKKRNDSYRVYSSAADKSDECEEHLEKGRIEEAKKIFEEVSEDLKNRDRPSFVRLLAALGLKVFTAAADYEKAISCGEELFTIVDQTDRSYSDHYYDHERFVEILRLTGRIEEAEEREAIALAVEFKSVGTGGISPYGSKDQKIADKIKTAKVKIKSAADKESSGLLLLKKHIRGAEVALELYKLRDEMKSHDRKMSTRIPSSGVIGHVAANSSISPEDIPNREKELVIKIAKANRTLISLGYQPNDAAEALEELAALHYIKGNIVESEKTLLEAFDAHSKKTFEYYRDPEQQAADDLAAYTMRISTDLAFVTKQQGRYEDAAKLMIAAFDRISRHSDEMYRKRALELFSLVIDSILQSCTYKDLNRIIHTGLELAKEFRVHFTGCQRHYLLAFASLSDAFDAQENLTGFSIDPVQSLSVADQHISLLSRRPAGNDAMVAGLQIDLAGMYVTNGHLDRAKELIKKVTDNANRYDFPVRKTLLFAADFYNAVILIHRSETEEALRVLHKLVAIRPDNHIERVQFAGTVGLLTDASTGQPWLRNAVSPEKLEKFLDKAMIALGQQQGHTELKAEIERLQRSIRNPFE